MWGNFICNFDKIGKFWCSFYKLFFDFFGIIWIVWLRIEFIIIVGIFFCNSVKYFVVKGFFFN